jgi:hypothetical protein
LRSSIQAQWLGEDFWEPRREHHEAWLCRSHEKWHCQWKQVMLLNQSLPAYFSTHWGTCIACICCSVLTFTSAATFRPSQAWMLLKNLPDCCLKQIHLRLQLWVDFHGLQWKTCLTFVIKLFTPHVNCITLHWVLSTVSIKHKLHNCHWTWLWNMNTQHLFLCRNHCHNMCTPGRLERKGFNFWRGLKKFCVYQLIHQNLVSHASSIVLWTAESVSFFFNCPVHDLMYYICFFWVHLFIHSTFIKST